MLIDIRQPGWLCVGILALCKVDFVSGFCEPCNVLKIAWGSVGKVMGDCICAGCSIGWHTTRRLAKYFVPILINFQHKMEQTVIRYWNKKLNMGMVDWRTVYLLGREPVLLKPEVYKGALIYRIPGTSKRFSYADFKAGAVKKRIIINHYLPF